MKRKSLFIALALVAGAGTAAAVAPKAVLQTAVFAGGCFWSMETDFDKVPGVVSTVSGYSGGAERNPTYEQVSSETTGHLESVKVTFDPAKITYRQLADKYLRTIDPTDKGGQFCDRGASYRTAIFATAAQKTDADAALAAAGAELKRPIATVERPAAAFWPAEGYHQNYAQKNPDHYHRYRAGCGRDARVKQLWGRSPF
jgi:peptide-methionine (S)-S-oxide reductase